MELEIRVADDMQATEPPVKRVRPRIVPTYKPLTRSEYIAAHRLLLAQALAVSFYLLIIGNTDAV